MNRFDKYTLNVTIEVGKKKCMLGGGLLSLCCAIHSQPNHRISFPFMANENDSHVVSKLTWTSASCCDLVNVDLHVAICID